MVAEILSTLCHLPSSMFDDTRNLAHLFGQLTREVNKLATELTKARKVVIFCGLISLTLAIILFWCHSSNSLALSALSYLLTFDLCCLLVALLSIWVERQRPCITYSLGYERLEVVAVFTSTMLFTLSSFFVLKEAVERFFEPVDVFSGRLMLGALLTLFVHLITVYSVDNKAMNHVIEASGSNWLQEHVTDMSESLCQLVPGLSKALLPRLNPICLLGTSACLTLVFVDLFIDLYQHSMADSMGALLIALMTCGTMMPMAVYSGRILLHTTPSHLLAQLDKALREASTLDGVLELRKEHFWTLGFGRLVGSLHVRVRRDANEQMVLAHVTNRLCPLVHKLTVQVFKDDWTRSVGSYSFSWPVNQPARVNPFLAENLPDLVPSPSIPPTHTSTPGLPLTGGPLPFILPSTHNTPTSGGPNHVH